MATIAILGAGLGGVASAGLLAPRLPLGVLRDEQVVADYRRAAALGLDGLAITRCVMLLSRTRLQGSLLLMAHVRDDLAVLEDDLPTGAGGKCRVVRDHDQRRALLAV